jgi:hypothetical protein
MGPIPLPVVIGVAGVLLIAAVYIFWARKGSKSQES